MKKKQPNRYNVQSISFPSKEMLELAKKQASSLDISLSKYINRLVKADLEKRGDLTKDNPMNPSEIALSSEPNKNQEKKDSDTFDLKTYSNQLSRTTLSKNEDNRRDC